MYLFACGFKSFLTMAKEKQQNRNKKKYFEITLYSSFYKSAFENSKSWGCVCVCIFVLISQSKHMNTRPSAHTHTHIRINFVCIQASFGLYNFGVNSGVAICCGSCSSFTQDITFILSFYLPKFPFYGTPGQNERKILR